jgi:hypothetical protein
MTITLAGNTRETVIVGRVRLSENIERSSVMPTWFKKYGENPAARRSCVFLVQTLVVKRFRGLTQDAKTE